MATSDDDDRADGMEGDEPGEGNHSADQRYRDAVRRYIDEGKVDPAAREASRAVDDDDEREELERAEQIGRSRAADEPADE